MEMCGERLYSSTILNLGTRWVVVSFKALPLYPRGRFTSTPSVGGLVGHRAGLDAVETRKVTMTGHVSKEICPLLP
jgi:hypothetical protein